MSTSSKNESADAVNHPEASTAQQHNSHVDGKFLTFFLENEEYGLEILKVVEINGMMDITPIPGTPQYIRGVINLRGKIIPVIDLRLKFNMKAAEQTEETVIIVVQAQGIEIGAVVDKVSEVIDIAANDIEDAPSFGTEVNTDYIIGIGKSEGRVKLLLDIDKVITTQDLTDIHAAKIMEESNALL